MSGPTPTDPDQGTPARPPSTGGLLGRRHLRTPREALQPDDAPPPPPKPSRRRPALSAFSGFLSFLLILSVAGAGLFVWSQQQMRAPGPLVVDKVVLIAPRTEVYEIISQLERDGVISNSLLLNAALVIEGNRSKVKAGEYLFKQNASLREVIDTLISGREILHSITIPEGLTSEQILQRLKENELLSGEVRDIPKEGTLLPDTYRVARGMSRSDLVRKMQEDQKRVLEQVWARRAADIPLRSPFELLTLASIVEKETGKADERPRVAGVFINRLTKRMRLQSDPTIVYGIVGGKGTLGRGILRSEVDRATPYNTYQIDGLPPGPIANPGRAALEAVANPSRTKDVFFVADGTGGHVFAETLEQHQRNVARWRQIERDMKNQQNGGAAPVDRVQPDPVAPTRDQRGEAPAPSVTVPIYGSLGGLGGLGGRATNVAEAEAPAPAPVALASAAPQPARNPSGRPSPAQSGQFGLEPKLDKTLGSNFPASRSILDGPMDEAAEQIDPTLYPVNPDRRSDQRSRSARLGMPTGSDELASTQNDSLRPSQYASEPATRVVRIYDASEGTPLDPLKNKTWDLNSPKTVPVLRPEDGAEKAPAAARKPKAPAPQATAPKPAAPARSAAQAEPQEGESAANETTEAKPQPKVAAKPAPKPAKPRAKPAPKPATDDNDETATN